VLAAAAGLNNAQIGRRVGLDVDTLRVWRSRQSAVTPDLAAAAEAVDAAVPKRLVVLEATSGSGAPPSFRAEKICQVLA
jgi:hypothetical protein